MIHILAQTDSIYCKRGYFRWGNISRKHWQDISRGGNFHDITPIIFITEGIWVLFSRGGNFREEDKSAKNAKITPRDNFHVYSIVLQYYKVPFLIKGNNSYKKVI